MNIPNIPKHCEVETSKFFFSLAACLVIKKPPLIRRSPLRSQSSSAHQGGPPFTPSKLPSFGEISLQTLWKLEKLAPTRTSIRESGALHKPLVCGFIFVSFCVCRRAGSILGRFWMVKSCEMLGMCRWSETHPNSAAPFALRCHLSR